MHIPPRFDELLRKNQGLHGAVEQTLSRFEVWLQDNKIVFFPEYTDHEPDHVESVIWGAAELIREESWQHLTPQDAAVMLLSILLHDCAMHLSQDGFLALVVPGSAWAPRGRSFLDDMDDRPWPGLWNEFLREASRFDAEKLKALFGEPEPVRRPPESWAKWTRNDHLLIGEFLRRHWQSNQMPMGFGLAVLDHGPHNGDRLSSARTTPLACDFIRQQGQRPMCYHCRHHGPHDDD